MTECLRVDQLDAHILDGEIQKIAFSGLDEVLNGLPVYVTRLFDNVKPELRLFIDATLWSTRIYGGASPGQKIMSVHYKDYSTGKVGMHFGVSVLLPYLEKRLTSLYRNSPITRKFDKLDAVIEAFEVLYYLYFLRTGGHSTMTEKILGLRNWTEDIQMINTVNYDSQNRELLWQAFRDVLVLLWPLIRVADAWWARLNRTRTAHDGTTCALCSDKLVAAVDLSCGHRCCYWCVHSQDNVNVCPRCEEKVCVKIAKGKKVDNL